jgi:hypothetical protein
MNIKLKEEQITLRVVTIELVGDEGYKLAKLLDEEIHFEDAERTHGFPSGTLTNLHAALMGQRGA